MLSTMVNKSTPFVQDYLAALLAQASNLISAQFHETVIAKGFTVSEWRALASLADSPPIPVGQLAKLALTKQPTMTRLLDRLEARGKIKRLPHAKDRRVILVGITPKGRRAVDELISLAKAHELQVLKPFGRSQAEALKASLKNIVFGE